MLLNIYPGIFVKGGTITSEMTQIHTRQQTVWRSQRGFNGEIYSTPGRMEPAARSGGVRKYACHILFWNIKKQLKLTVFLFFLSWKLIFAGCGHGQRQRNNFVYCVSKYDRKFWFKESLISSRTCAYFFSRDLIFTVWVFLACLSGRCNEIQKKQLFWLVWVWTGPGWTELGQSSDGSRSHLASAVKPPTERGSCHGRAFTVVMKGREDTGWGVPDHLAEFIKTLMKWWS